ncbi:MAG: peptide-methionine (S)-S-oxide reductase MsrA [Acidiferrobacterales bacterium]|nr:peptide-methionine (S)-S-oxide reductase MsrA [Acidiferrobacterales bacterium]
MFIKQGFINSTLCLLITAVMFSSSQAQQAESPFVNKTAVFAGGCFWCIEADFEKLDGVLDVVSGYTGGSQETANYKTVTYEETGHFEAVEVTYDSTKVSYAELVEYFWRHIDPTDDLGQFCDKGSSYRSAVFYADEKEKQVIDNSLAVLNESKPFSDDIVTTVAEAQPFYLAEDYHQDYYKKNPIRYNFYRKGCKRDARVAELWGE